LPAAAPSGNARTNCYNNDTVLPHAEADFARPLPILAKLI